MELPAKQQSQSSPFGPFSQCCLAGSSFKTAPSILISTAMGVDYSLELISIETYAPQFIGQNDLFLGSAVCLLSMLVTLLRQNRITPKLLRLWKIQHSNENAVHRPHTDQKFTFALA